MTSAATSRRARQMLLVGLLLVALAVALTWANRGDPARGSAVATSSSTAVQNPSAAVTTPRSGLPTMAESALPGDARHTLAVIRDGGPFPYRQDGQTFGNREGLLPDQANGYYREYTVKAGTSGDRGPRRIIAGRSGDLYWTSDHYAHFAQIVEER